MELGTYLYLTLYLSSAVPVFVAWRYHRRSSLAHALHWTIAAWLSWALVLTGEAGAWLRPGGALRFVALCLVGCAGVAVLGARRPGAVAWNFVVLGLLAVLLLFWAEGLLASGTIHLGGIRLLFLAGTLGVGILNYLPTRLGLGAMLLATACGLELWSWAEPVTRWEARQFVSACLLALAPWTAWLSLRWRAPAMSAFDGLWWDFRDGYGLVWGQRLREQFNNAARHAGLPVELRWHGLQATSGTNPDGATHDASLRTLHALLKRFGLLHEVAGEPDREA
ncbi:MAG: hypothetical protein JNM56_34345 [Planctomycetia bacterium]|nr:hypothetical protein [Planctomycetia bacterium]